MKYNSYYLVLSEPELHQFKPQIEETLNHLIPSLKAFLGDEIIRTELSSKDIKEAFKRLLNASEQPEYISLNIKQLILERTRLK